MNQLVYIKRIPKRFYKSAIEEADYHLSSKLQARFAGPYRITEVLSPVLYRAEIHGREKTIHAINMKPSRTYLDVSDSQLPPEEQWQAVKQFTPFEYDNVPSGLTSEVTLPPLDPENPQFSTLQDMALDSSVFPSPLESVTNSPM